MYLIDLITKYDDGFDELKNSNEFLIAHKISFSFLVHITVFMNQVQRYVYINFIYAIFFFIFLMNIAAARHFCEFPARNPYNLIE